MIHIWWNCLNIKQFWETVYNEMKKMFRYSFRKTSEGFLLGIVPGSLKEEDKTLYLYATVAARLLIAKNWKSGIVPTKIEWLAKLLEYYNISKTMGEIGRISKEKIDRDWKVFKGYLQNHIEKSELLLE